MNQTKRLIFKLAGLEKSFGTYNALKVSKLEIHPGTIYGIIGTVGSGKSTLLNILAGVESQTSGTILYDDQVYKKNWFGKITPPSDVFYSRNLELSNSSQTISGYVSSKFGKKKNVIENRYFNEGSFKNLWNRKIKDVSPGEINWLGMILACEVDPRVLLIDDYGVYFNNNMEKDFRNQITKMNRTLGTTIVLSASNDNSLKHFASVLVYLDHGHISKIRPGVSRKPNRNNRKYKTPLNKRPNKSNQKPKINKPKS